MGLLLAFSVEQVSRLTGLSNWQLRYWDTTEFFHPAYAQRHRRAYGRVYSFRDVVGLRLIATLRKDYKIPLPQLRELARWFDDNIDEPWSTLRFYVDGKRIRFDDPRYGLR